jgi:DNA invertase Pin-like site-specific DNA recombinase
MLYSMNTNHIAIYCRCSTDKQTTKSQEADLKAWAARQELPCKFYRDTISGKTMDRPAWNKLDAQIKLGSVKQVVVWRLDRLGRTAQGLTTLFADLIAAKVNLTSLKDGLDLCTPAGRLMAHVLASVAQFERELISERILAGQAVAKASGKTWGGRKVGTRIVVTDEQITNILRMHHEGATKTAMAKATGLSRPTIYHILSTHPSQR